MTGLPLAGGFTSRSSNAPRHIKLCIPMNISIHGISILHARANAPFRPQIQSDLLQRLAFRSFLVCLTGLHLSARKRHLVYGSIINPIDKLRPSSCLGQRTCPLHLSRGFTARRIYSTSGSPACTQSTIYSNSMR